MEAVRLIIEGRVQGVGFRYFTQDAAQALQLTGWVHNLPNGGVEAYAEGTKLDLESWIGSLRQGPPMSRVEKIEIEWLIPKNSTADFSIR